MLTSQPWQRVPQDTPGNVGLETAWFAKTVSVCGTLLTPSGEARDSTRPSKMKYPAQGVLSTNLTLGQRGFCLF